MKPYRWGIILSVATILNGWSHADNASDTQIQLQHLQKQIDALQQNQDAIQLNTQRENPVQAFSTSKFTLGGWVTAAMTTHQATGTDRYAFNDTDFGLLASVDVSERTHFLGNLEFHRTAEDLNIQTPDRRFDNYSNSVEMEIAQISHDFSDLLGIRAGEIIAPFGIINVEHFDPIHLQNDLPQFLRDMPGVPFVMFSDIINGVDLYGHVAPLSGHRLGWEMYGCSLNSDTNRLAGGGRQTWSFPNDHVALGVSEQAGSRDGNTFVTLGQDVKIQYNRFLVRSEAAQTLVNEEHINAFYVQPSFHITEKWIAFTQVDYLDNPLNVSQEALDPIRQYEYTLGLNFLPVPNLRLRLEATDHSYVGVNQKFQGRDRDYWSFQTSFTVSF